MLGIENPPLPLRPTNGAPRAGNGEDTGSVARPARDAYLAALAAREELTAKDNAWVEKENAERAHITAKENAEAAYAAAEQAKVDALADKEVLGAAPADPLAQDAAVRTALDTLSSARPRAALAVAKLSRIRHQRALIRDQAIAVNSTLRELRHAALEEVLSERLAVLLEAEGAYLTAICSAYGVAAVVDESARMPGPRLDFAGTLDVQEVYLPRPFHPAFVDVPSPARSDIAAAIVREAE